MHDRFVKPIIDPENTVYDPANYEMLDRKINPSIIQKDKIRGFDFITVNEVVRMLNSAYSQRWSYEVVERWTEELFGWDLLFHVHGRLTIDGHGAREQVSTASFKDHCVKRTGKSKKLDDLEAADLINSNFEMVYKTAVSDNIKKLASYFRIAQELYGGAEEGLFQSDELTSTQEGKISQIRTHLGEDEFNLVLKDWKEENGELINSNFNSFLVYARSKAVTA